LRSVDRIAALILVIAAVTILVLAILVISDVRLETELNREVIGALQAQDGLESLRSRLHELKYAARDVALTGDPEATRAIERRAIEADADLAYLQERSRTDPLLAQTIAPLTAHVKPFIMQGRATRALSGVKAGPVDPERGAVEARAWEAVERSLEAQTRRINERALQQIRIGENLDGYVMWLLAGSITVLGALFAVFQHTQARNREAQRRIERLAHYDMVTSLPNRSLLSDRLGQEVARSARAKEGFAVAMFDLDGFKDVNDTLGHAAGDRLLAEVARRARECVRASDTLGRLGGDEFLAVLPRTGEEGAMQVAEKIRNELAKPYDIAGKSARISASVGVGLFPEHGADTEALLRSADAALYEAKRAGRNRAKLARGPAAA
jgi:diguanylate cyclase (GGDEF)-like protein